MDSKYLECSVKTLFNPSRFTHPFPEIVKFGTADLASTQDFNAGNPGRMKQEDSFNTNPLKNFADGDGFIKAAIAFSNDCPLKGLDSFFPPLNNLDANFDGVTNMDGRQIVFNELCFDGLNYRLGIHGDSKNSQFPIITD